jgi:cytochrome d ubiquinol oxidase subunit I
VWKLISSDWALWAFGHTILAGLTVGATVMFGICCWQILRGRSVETFKRAAKLSLIVLVPVACFNLWFGSHFGILVEELQPMKIAASEAQWNTCTDCAFSAIQIGGFTSQDPTPSFSIEIPGLLSYLATGSFSGQVEGLNQLNAQYQQMYGPGDYMPPVEVIYWSMRAMAGAGTVVALVAILGAVLYWRRRLERWRWFLWVGVATIFVPFIATTAGWVLTEMGRQPWIVQGLLKTADANSPSVTSTWIVTSLTVFVLLYIILLVADFWLMRRYAGRDLAEETEAEAPDRPPVPAY